MYRLISRSRNTPALPDHDPLERGPLLNLTVAHRRRELEEWRQKREEERKAREDRERKQEQEDRRAKRILGEHMNDMAKERLQEWTERRRKQLEKGTALREERTRHFNVHGGGVTTGRTQVGRATLKAAHDLDMRDMSTAVARSEALRYFTGIPAGSKVPCTSIPGL